MVTTRSMLKQQNPKIYSQENLVSDDGVFAPDEQTDSDMETESYTESDVENNNTVNSINIHTRFSEALVSDNWLNTSFHSKIFNIYINPLLFFHENQFFENEIEWKQFLLQDNNTEFNYILEKIEPYVDKCSLCNKTRTISVTIKYSNSIFKCGRTCGEKFETVLNMYKYLKDIIIYETKHRQIVLYDVMNSLDKVLTKFSEEF